MSDGIEAAFKAGWVAGFASTGEGYNQEYPFDQWAGSGPFAAPARLAKAEASRAETREADWLDYAKALDKS